MRYDQTWDFLKLRKRTESELEFISRLSNVSCAEEAMILFNLNGYEDRVDFNVFMVVLGYALSEGCQNKKLIDVLIDIAETSNVLDDAFKMKLFWNTCGRWIKSNYSSKDKTMFYKVSVLLGLAGRKQLAVNNLK